MTTIAKIVTLLILASLAVLVIKNPSGFSKDAGTVTQGLDQTLVITSGQGT